MDLKFRQEKISDFFEKQHIEGLPFGAVLHHFSEADSGDPHDHPFNFTSHILHGWYEEKIYMKNSDGLSVNFKVREAGSSHRVSAHTIHRIIEVSPGGCYTLIIPEQKIKEPGFYRFENGQLLFRQWNEKEFKTLK